MAKRAIFQVDDLINDYVNEGLGMEPLCAKYHTSKQTIRKILKVNGIPTRKIGGQSFNEKFVVKDFHIKKVEIELLDKKEYTEQEELVNDMMMLIASFSGKVYSLRAKENRKKRNQERSKV